MLAEFKRISRLDNLVHYDNRFVFSQTALHTRKILQVSPYIQGSVHMIPYLDAIFFFGIVSAQRNFDFRH